MPKPSSFSFAHICQQCFLCGSYKEDKFYFCEKDGQKDLTICCDCFSNYHDFFLKIDVSKKNNYFKSIWRSTMNISCISSLNHTNKIIEKEIMNIMKKEKPWTDQVLHVTIFGYFKRLKKCTHYKCFQISLQEWFPFTKIYKYEDIYMILLSTYNGDVAMIMYDGECFMSQMIYIGSNAYQIAKDIMRLEVFHYMKIMMNVNFDETLTI